MYEYNDHNIVFRARLTVHVTVQKLNYMNIKFVLKNL